MDKIRELDGLRGLLAVWVVCVHLLASVGVSPKSFGFFAPLFGEHMRVQIFCILSGFVIFLMQSRRPEAYAPFLAGRLRRIYPAYLLAFTLSVLTAGLALDAAREAPFQGARLIARVTLFEGGFARMPEHILAHLTLLHGLIPEDWLPSAAYAFLGQAWNVSTEAQFYLVAPLLFLGLATGPVWRRGAVAVSCLLLWVLLRNWPNPADLAQYAPYFLLGILSFLLWRQDWSDRRRLNPLLVSGLAGAIFLLADMSAGIWIFVLGWLVLKRDQGRGQVAIGWLAFPPFQWLGGLSYSLYLLHMIPLYLGMSLLNHAGLSREIYLAALTLFTFALALPMAWLSATQVEQRFAAQRRARGSTEPQGAGIFCAAEKQEEVQAIGTLSLPGPARQFRR